MKLQGTKTALIVTLIFTSVCATFGTPALAAELTLSQKLAILDAVVLAKLVSNPTDQGPAKFEFEVIEVLQQTQKGTLDRGSKITAPSGISMAIGDHFLIPGRFNRQKFECDYPLELSQPACRYLRNAPRPDANPGIIRLAYFLNFLEDPDRMINEDAFLEFAKASPRDLVKLRREFSRDKVRSWLENPKLGPGRLGVYGMMLGLCGNASDAQFLESKILEPVQKIRPGIEGVMSGYLFLEGERGLSRLDVMTLGNPKTSYNERLAAIQAVRFIRQFGDNRIELDRLRQSMRLALDDPDVAYVAIDELARMHDWSVQDRLIELYDSKAFNLSSTKMAIVLFASAAAHDTKSQMGNDHVVKARRWLAELEQRDPQIVLDARRLLGQ